MLCSMYALTTPAVFSGRRVIELSFLSFPPTQKVYISLFTMSVESPTPLLNSSVASKIGVLISL